MSWSRRLLNLFRGERLAHDIDREMAFHLSEKADELEAGGMSRADAEREARRRFGHRGTARERTREVDVLGWLESLAADVRYALRSLRANPGFTAVAVISLGLGIGANTAIFSLVNAVILRTLPVADPEQLVRVQMRENAYFTNPIWEGVRDTPGLENYFAYSTTRFDLAGGGESRRAPGTWVSGSYFPVLGVRPIVGRLLEPADDRRGCAATAVVSKGFAERQFGGTAGAVGQALPLNGYSFEVIGVVEPAFTGLEVGRTSAIYAPICAMDVVSPGRGFLDRRSMWWLEVLGRLEPGQTEAQASARIEAASAAIFAATIPPNWAASDQEQYAQHRLGVKAASGGFSSLRATYKDALFVLFAVVGSVLLIGCANVANLLLARAAARQHELAVRLAIGAGRGRLIRQLLTESLLLAFAGGAAGLLFARWASSLLVRFLSTRDNPVFLDLTLDQPVLLFSLAVATITGLLFGLAPAWRVTRVDPQSAMKAQGRGVTYGAGRFALGRALVVGQVALSLVLVVAAGLLMGSFRKLMTLDPGFRREGILLASMDLSRTGWPEAQRRATHQVLLDRLRLLPGVQNAAASFTTPIGNSFWNAAISVDGRRAAAAPDSSVMFNPVSDGWFATMGTRLLAGRDFTRGDGKPGAEAVIINESLARRFFGESAPLGREIRIANGSGQGLGPAMEVVAVVRDVKYGSIDEENQPTAYVPLAQGEWVGQGVEMALRTDGPLAAVVPSITRMAAEVSPSISLEFVALSEQVNSSLRRPRVLATLSGFFAALALILAVVGLYGTVAYGVTRRRTEIGIRLALGAARGNVLRMVLGDAGRLVLLGIGAGVLIAIGTTRLLEAFLYGLAPNDTGTLVASAAVLLGAATVASAIPAWRAASLDPTETLREE